MISSRVWDTSATMMTSSALRLAQKVQPCLFTHIQMSLIMSIFNHLTGMFVVYLLFLVIYFTILRFNLQVFDRNAIHETCELDKILPAEFLADNLDGKFSGHYIYLSLGSMGAIDLTLMDKLVKYLGKTNHKYIVSKGPRHEEYILARNMYGDRFLPQTKIVPSVDLVITHGGNNTVTETFAVGKPMVSVF